MTINNRETFIMAKLAFLLIFVPSFSFAFGAKKICKDLEANRVYSETIPSYSSEQLDQDESLETDPLDIRVSFDPNEDVRIPTESWGMGYSWELIQIPHEFFKKVAIFVNLPQLEKASDLRDLQGTLKNTQYKSPNETDRAKLKWLVDLIKSQRSEGFRSVYPFFFNRIAPLTCIQKYHQGLNSGCVQALNDMLVNNGPSGNYGLFLENIISEILLKPIYSRTLNSVAVKLIDNFFDPNLPVNNLFDDLANAFRIQGLNENQSIESSMKVMAFLSLQGPEIYPILKAFLKDSFIAYDSQVMTAAHLLSTIPTLIDIRQINSSKPIYTLPPSVQSTCHSGKFYHFWMSAWWSWKYSNQYKKNPEKQKSASLAVWLAAVSYQKFSNTQYRYVLGSLTMSADATYSSISRRDLSYYASGINFGKEIANRQNRKWNQFSKTSVDADLQKMLDGLTKTEPITTQDKISQVLQSAKEGNPYSILKLNYYSQKWDELINTDRIFPKK